SMTWDEGVLVGSATVFFFSSRRRHTRFSRDWSSDVCSSDLQQSCKTCQCWQGVPKKSDGSVDQLHDRRCSRNNTAKTPQAQQSCKTCQCWQGVPKKSDGSVDQLHDRRFSRSNAAKTPQAQQEGL